MLYKVEQFTKGSILTTERANERAARIGTIVEISSIKHKVFFFTNDHLFGYPTLPREFVPSTDASPMRVMPRPEIPDGMIKNAEEYMALFSKGYRQITTVEELVDFLNSTLP